MAGALLLGYFFALFRDHPEESLAHPCIRAGIGLEERRLRWAP